MKMEKCTHKCPFVTHVGTRFSLSHCTLDACTNVELNVNWSERIFFLYEDTRKSTGAVREYRLMSATAHRTMPSRRSARIRSDQVNC